MIAKDFLKFLLRGLPMIVTFQIHPCREDLWCFLLSCWFFWRGFRWFPFFEFRWQLFFQKTDNDLYSSICIHFLQKIDILSSFLNLIHLTEKTLNGSTFPIYSCWLVLVWKIWYIPLYCIFFSISSQFLIENAGFFFQIQIIVCGWLQKISNIFINSTCSFSDHFDDVTPVPAGFRFTFFHVPLNCPYWYGEAGNTVLSRRWMKWLSGMAICMAWFATSKYHVLQSTPMYSVQFIPFCISESSRCKSHNPCRVLKHESK